MHGDMRWVVQRNPSHCSRPPGVRCGILDGIGIWFTPCAMHILSSPCICHCSPVHVLFYLYLANRSGCMSGTYSEWPRTQRNGFLHAYLYTSRAGRNTLLSSASSAPCSVKDWLLFPTGIRAVQCQEVRCMVVLVTTVPPTLKV